MSIDVLNTPKKWKEIHDTSFHFQDFQCTSSDQRCRGGCRRAACGPEEERIAGFLKKSFRAAGIQTAAFLGFRAAKAALFFYGLRISWITTWIFMQDSGL